VNTAELTALLVSFVFGVLFALVSAWPRRPSEPHVSWPAMLDDDARLAIAVQLTARTGDASRQILLRAQQEERDPRIRAVVDQALGPVIGEPR
jgi:hypothetical protein